MIDSDSIAGCREQSNEVASEEHGVKPRRQRMSERLEHNAVKQYDNGQHVTAEPGHVAEHQEPIGAPHSFAQCPVAPPKRSQLSSERTPIVDGAPESCVRHAELVDQHIGQQLIHHLRKHPRLNDVRVDDDEDDLGDCQSASADGDMGCQRSQHEVELPLDEEQQVDDLLEQQAERQQQTTQCTLYKPKK